MRKYLISLGFLFFGNTGFSQDPAGMGNKPALSFADLGKWPSLSGLSVSNNGQYVCYAVDDPATGTIDVHLKSIRRDWEVDLGFCSCQFTADSRYAIYKNRGDSLVLLNLNERSADFVAGVSSFQLSKRGRYLGYFIKDGGRMVIRNLRSNRQFSYDSVIDVKFDEEHDAAAVVKSSGGNAFMELIGLTDGSPKVVWSGNKLDRVGTMLFSDDGEVFAFEVRSKGRTDILAFKNGERGAQEAGRLDATMEDAFCIDGLDESGFADNNQRLFIRIKERDTLRPRKGLVDVEIWNSRDPRLRSEQIKQLRIRKTYLAAIDLGKGCIVPVEKGDEKVIGRTQGYALVARTAGDITYDESFWNRSVCSSLILVSLSDGKRTTIKDGMPAGITTAAWFSPSGHFVLYYDPIGKNYFSYDVATGIHRNITRNVAARWTRYDRRDVAMGRYMPISCQKAGAVVGDKGILLYDQCDVYLADPWGKRDPVNLTNGYGKRENIAFRVAMENRQQYGENDSIILRAFNRRTKDNGFYAVFLNRRGNPELRTMQPYVFTGTWEDDRVAPVAPVKAEDSNLYIVRRMSAEQSPNYFWTCDFKAFHSITNIHPESGTNWISSQLITWKMPDGKLEQGVLYKPENFDPAKKYPLIFQYYERLTEGLHDFLMPDFSHGEINIPYFVSNGYLVFTPDIHYVIGHPGSSVVKTVVSAARFLAGLSYVDSSHMGIIGHSRGGWETNFIVTHSDKFAAAVSASGMVDYVSLYNGVRLSRSGTSRQTGFESLFQRIGATLWERPDLYIENSPIFKADKVKTPLLIMANQNDDDVPFDQGLAFYNALRRLGKTAWMLEYAAGKHMVFDRAAEDYTKRVKQFFDHYLKGAREPVWMARVLPEKLKGTSDWLDLVP